MMSRSHTSGRRLLLLALLPALALAALFAFHVVEKDDDALVVYCAHDATYAERIIALFEKKTGIRVIPKFDTEATKSLGLVELLEMERAHPRCDVFWNNQTLGTMDLAAKGLLLPCHVPNQARIPDAFKDPAGRWTGFAARMRVFIVNTEAMPATRSAIRKAMNDNLNRMAIAKPLYGTTLTHFALLAEQLGFDGLRARHEKMLADGLKVLNGNSAVKDAVSAGGCDFGWTDTDDFLVAKRSGAPVASLPVELPDGKTIVIPNSVAVIKGTKKLDKAKAFVDFLLSEECEIALANSAAGQIPLGPVDEGKIPPFVRGIKKLSANSAPLTSKLLAPRRKCVEWLREFRGPKR